MTSINGNFVGLEAVNGEVGWNKKKTREEKGGKFNISKRNFAPTSS